MLLARFLAVAAILTAADMAAAQTYPFEGRWARQASYCRNTWGRVDNPDRVPITVATRRLQGPLITCNFQSVTAAGANRWRITATCEGEGERNRETFSLSLANDRLTWHWGSQPPTYVRCPR